MANIASGAALALGGPKLLGRAVRTPADLAAAIRRGLPTGSLQALAARLALDRAATAAAVGMAPRTLSRRLASRRRLTPVESDRAARLARVFSLAAAMLGSQTHATAWLQTPNRALGGAKPLAQLDTEPGTAEVEQVLGRIGYGGYS
ncbi:MAG: type II RES/Xre toxin-antitoxin system antitoxin [Terriglobales bacterium]